MEEIWKDIEGYEGYYQVSNCGNVKSLCRLKKCGNKQYITKVKILKQFKDKYGYKTISLSRDSINKRMLVHRIVAKSYIVNNENKNEVNHINGVKDDNRIENLEWCTSSENSIHAIKLGLKIMKGGKDHYLYGKTKEHSQFYKDKGYCYGKFGSNHPVGKLILDTQTGIFYESILDVCKLLGNTPNTIRRKLNGARKNNTSLMYV